MSAQLLYLVQRLNLECGGEGSLITLAVVLRGKVQVLKSASQDSMKQAVHQVARFPASPRSDWATAK